APRRRFLGHASRREQSHLRPGRRHLLAERRLHDAQPRAPVGSVVAVVRQRDVSVRPAPFYHLDARAEFAESATYALALAKKMFQAMAVPTLEQLCEMETLASGIVRLTHDHREGVAAFKEELTDYKTSKGAIQFPLTKPIPYELVRRIVRFRVEEAKQKKKQDK
ncbi:MAG TPA: hypothetical protein PK051_06395, partial [Trichococcus flocculiformis]|nr:hypothetical protein [Trichococcus flocculiformis]